jgi:hypothetical protein
MMVRRFKVGLGDLGHLEVWCLCSSTSRVGGRGNLEGSTARQGREIFIH